MIRIARMISIPRQLRPRVLARSLSSSNTLLKDNLEWLKPTVVPLEESLSKMKSKIAENSSSDELKFVANEILTGRRPPVRKQNTKNRDLHDLTEKFLAANPTVRLHLVIFYSKYFHEIGISGVRTPGWRIKQQLPYSAHDVVNSIKFYESLLLEKFNRNYNEDFAKLSLGSPADVRWNRLKTILDEETISAVEKRWSGDIRFNPDSFEDEFWQGNLEYSESELPCFAELNLSHEISELLKKDRQKEVEYDFPTISEHVNKIVSTQDERVTPAEIQLKLRSGEIVSESELYTAFIYKRIRRPRLNVAAIQNSFFRFQKLCALRSLPSNLVDNVIAAKKDLLEATKFAKRATDLWRSEQEKFDEKFSVEAEKKVPYYFHKYSLKKKHSVCCKRKRRNEKV